VPVGGSQRGGLSSAATRVTVQVGGNDAGFADVITSCARPWPWTCWGDIDEANRIIRDELPGRLDGLYTDIRNRAPNAKVIVVGYPRLFNGEECNALARISPEEQQRLNETADLLAGTIGGRASAHGCTFVDVRGSWTGHAVCDDVEWVNGLSNPILESYHPNVAGHRDGYAPAVRSQFVAVPSAAWSRARGTMFGRRGGPCRGYPTHNLRCRNLRTWQNSSTHRWSWPPRQRSRPSGSSSTSGEPSTSRPPGARSSPARTSAISTSSSAGSARSRSSAWCDSWPSVRCSTIASPGR